jgi:hypothetical protein
VRLVPSSAVVGIDDVSKWLYHVMASSRGIGLVPSSAMGPRLLNMRFIFLLVLKSSSQAHVACVRGLVNGLVKEIMREVGEENAGVVPVKP